MRDVANSDLQLQTVLLICREIPRMGDNKFKAAMTRTDNASPVASLEDAIRQVRWDLVLLAALAGANLNDERLTLAGYNPLHIALSRNRFDVVSGLLKLKADPNTMQNGRAPLHTAAELGNAVLIRELVQAGAALDVMLCGDNPGYTPLFMAVSEGHVEATEVLLNLGAGPNVRCRNGRTALMAAADHGNVELAKLLLNYGADATALDSQHRSASQRALSQGHHAVASLITTMSKDNSIAAVARMFPRYRSDIER